MPAWLVRVVGRHWAVALAAGGVMLTYSLTIVAMLEILKANDDPLDRSFAVAVFALASIVTIAAPSFTRRSHPTAPRRTSTTGTTGLLAIPTRSASSS